MAVKKILGWGECTGINTPAVGDAVSYDDIVDGSASLSVEEGQEQEALIEGGVAEGRKQNPDKYIIEFDRRLGDETNIKIGFVENAGKIAIVPKNIGAVYAELDDCSRKITLKQNTQDGLVAHYLFKTKGRTDSEGNLDDVLVKKHLSASQTFSAVANPTGNPSTSGYYIKNGTTYIHAQDTSVVNGVTYYELVSAG
jgi:hypothetical protein